MVTSLQILLLIVDRLVLTDFLLGVILLTVLTLGHIAPDITLLGAFVILGFGKE